MSFNRANIAQIFKLARLSGEHTQEGNAIQADLEKIVKMVDEISQIETKGIAPMAHPLEATGACMAQPLRKDEVTEQDEREEFLKLAPNSEAGLYLVPPVIE